MLVEKKRLVKFKKMECHTEKKKKNLTYILRYCERQSFSMKLQEAYANIRMTLMVLDKM